MARFLGKAPYVHDPRSLRLEKYAVSLPNPKPWVNWASKVPVSSWGAMGNLDLGDCTCAAAGHMIQTWTADAGSMFVPSDSDILTAYEVVGGYVPGNPSTDNGAMISDVLSYWQKTGIAGHKIDAYAEIGANNHTLIRQAIDIFGSVDIGIQLPLAAQRMTNYWYMQGATSLTGDFAPGSWGGHSIPLVAYNSWSYICVSWGQLIRISLKFLESYCDERWAVLTPDFFSGAKSVSGFDLVQMQADLASI